jgi:preprotein translocase subunit SecD
MLAGSAWAADRADHSRFEVRLMLGEGPVSEPHETLPFLSGRQKREIAVSPEPVLTAKDVDHAVVRFQKDLLREVPDEYWTVQPDGSKKVVMYTPEDKRNATAEPRIDFYLTPEARERWRNFTRDHVGRQIAVIGNNAVLAKPIVSAAVFTGRLQIIAPDADPDKIRKLIEIMGLKEKRSPR